MKISRLNGLTSGETLDSAETIDVLYEADGDIEPGDAVMIDTAANLTGKLAIAATATNDHLLLGIYTGVGGSGAATTITNMDTGLHDAADGDVIYVRTYGAIDGHVGEISSASTGFVEVGDILTVSGTAGQLTDELITAPTDTTLPAFIALEAATAVSGAPTAAARAVFVRCM